MVDAIGQATSQFMPNISMSGIINVAGWFVFGVIIIMGGFWVWYSWKQKKVFNKVIRANGQVGKYWKNTYNDLAKAVKVGGGGFEILFLKKLKVYRIAYGGNFGDNTYDFYVMPDGYWYNSRQYGDVAHLDKNGGLMSVVTTNPLMRGQYSSLEKQINELHGEKRNFWDKYGGWVMSIAFILIAGVMLWLNYKEYATSTANMAPLVDKMGQLVDKINTLAGNLQVTTKVGNGLIPVA